MKVGDIERLAREAVDEHKASVGRPDLFLYDIPGMGCVYPRYSPDGAPLSVASMCVVLPGWGRASALDSEIPGTGVMNKGGGWYFAAVRIDPYSIEAGEVRGAVVAAIDAAVARWKADKAATPIDKALNVANYWAARLRQKWAA